MLTPVSDWRHLCRLLVVPEPASSILSMAAAVRCSATSCVVRVLVCIQTQDRNRYEINAHMQNIAGKHTVKWGFEWFRNMYNINTLSSGPAVTYASRPRLGLTPLHKRRRRQSTTNGSRITNNWLVCTTRGTAIICPSAAA